MSTLRLLRFAMTKIGPSEAQLAARNNTPRLQTIPYSHYCELARWALQLNGVHFDEVPHLPGLGFRVADLRGNDHLTKTGSFPGISSNISTKAERRRRRTAVPCLALPDGQVIKDTWEILNFAYHAGGVKETFVDEELKLKMDLEFGPAARVIVYYYLLDTPLFDRLVDECGSLHERLVFRMGRDRIAPEMRALMGINEASCSAATVAVRDFFEYASKRVQQRKRPSLRLRERSGQLDRAGMFMAIPPEDLAFSALAGILLVPPQYGGARWISGGKDGAHSVLMPPMSALPKPFHELCLELRDTPAGRLALHTYSKRLAFQRLGRSSLEAP